jgi:hypothetical protein
MPLNHDALHHRLHLYQLCSELLQLLYRSSKYYGDGDPELRERISSANAKRNEIFEQLYDMSENKQELLDAMWRIVNGPLSDKKRPWYFEAAMLVENNIKLRKE